tara:strand:+ start:1346 stop:3199 length:1854 start_codon:yes stop_codon:yes gene_type:complete
MALKYWFGFTDVENISHRVEISDVNYTGSSTKTFGTCSLEYSETKDTLEPIRGSGLRIDLEAGSTLTFSDLYSEEERTFSVVYKRDNQILFNGWLSPEGIFESLVTDKWFVSLDCTDGLGFLNNLSYVEDATGLPFVGKQSILDIVVNCLKRTRTPQNILTSVKIYYDGLNQSINTFQNVYFNADRFIKDDNNETIMNCEEVLKSVLEPFGAVITSHKGEWLIYKPNSLFDSSSQIFFQYNSLGVALSPTSRTIDFAFALGSQIDNYYPHHVNANQYKTIKSSIGAYRINYKYGLVKSLLSNIFLQSENGAINEWTINSTSNLSFNSTNLGVDFQLSSSSVKNITSDALSLSINQIITLDLRYKTLTSFAPSSFSSIGLFNYKVILVNGGTTYYYNGTDWATSDYTLTNSIGLTPRELSVSYNLPPLPSNGDLRIEIFTPTRFTNLFGSINFNKFSLSPFEESNQYVKGENHTFQRVLKPSSKIKDIKKVFNGDNPSDVYVGTVYKADQTTPTSLWTRQGAQETKSLLQIMGEERMKMYSKPLQIYKGDVYGYFDYLSLATINGLTGKFMPTSYNYDAATNITSLELMEVLNTDILTDIDYAVTLDYGNVVEPTIKG